MGDTAPPQASAGGLGGASGAGLLGGGSVTPRVHSAIVERLRARIAVCRQHHLSCEGRYERGRAESSDRERESTLQLLSLVQHGQGARKAGKHTKAATTTAATTTAPPPPPAAPVTASQAAATAAPPPPPDYHHHHQQHLLSGSNNGGSGGINGEQQPPASTPGDLRNSALIADVNTVTKRGLSGNSKKDELGRFCKWVLKIQWPWTEGGGGRGGRGGGEREVGGGGGRRGGGGGDAHINEG
ncbi:Mastermind-like protein 2 [Fukomys damarensis]|uniref:Mastermind-like protein 2 n=1 Tax=Fukomys damarensis TaxID=885580 RepID=A0A091E2D9_FUKDA|nr:Mastermind-like protein 2 [Fukomys damarensis]